MRRIWLLLALLACKTEETDTSDETGDPDDTDTADTDTADTAVPCSDFEFGGALDVPEGALVPEGEATVGLFPFEFVDQPQWSTTFATTKLALPAAGASGDFAFCVPAVPGDEFFQPIDDTGTDARAALFFVGAWMDDGDGTFESGEALVGGTMAFVAYVDGTLPPDMIDLGAEEGWNVVRFDITNMDAGPTSITPFQSGYTGLSFDANLLMNDRTSIDGVVSPQGLGTVKVGLMSGYDMVGLPAPADPLLSSVDVDVSSPGAVFTLPLVDPPADTVTTNVGDGPAGAEVGLFYAVAWEDMDDDGAFDDGTEPVLAHTLAAGDASRMVAWIHPIDFSAVFFAEVFGGVGWQVLEPSPVSNQPPLPADWDVGLVLDDQFN